MRPIITLLTDFGTADGYVAELKGALLALVPDATVVDATHDIAPQDIEAGRLALARYWRRFPAGTIHVAIVDPGVGSSRRALAVSSEGSFLVGPDNGLLSPALLGADARVVSLVIPAAAAPTFHGRDVFAPVAARLARGETLNALGDPVNDPIVRRTPAPRRRDDGALVGEVITVDRFGNAVTNLIPGPIAGARVEVAGRLLALVRSYADAPDRSPVAVIGSTGLVEIAVRDGSAARALELSRGSPVIWRSG